jgi:uncharacterized membrane protein YvlD (DUF360 family)
MSEEGDTFFVNLTEKLIGVFLIVIGAVMIYLTATTGGSSGLGAFTVFFGVLSFIMLIIGAFLLLARPSE